MSDQHSEHAPQDGSVPPPAPWGAPQQPGAPAQQVPGQPQPGAYPGYPEQPGYPQQGHPQQPGYPGQPGGQPFGQGFAPPPQQRPSALSGLADLGFTRRITPALARVVYLAVIVLAVLALIVAIIGAIGAFGMAGNPFVGGSQWTLYGLFFLATGPLGAFVVVAFARFWLEYFLDRAGERPEA